ncbi:hypothetical protein CFC21_008446 [Triticum aestivum]|uniref:Uncharacterized protein n=2 Tax=Triticum aestivum TaxID=4565 RepID=A0A9R1ISH0_WHEAT|nr:uncharacterized protein LOC123142094 [Triticum aestivum]XP_044417058.1 uncharacterized protein LOC123142094 [Triticum aestivum]KAF6991355.1 hypothetical protein CFC21_008446 [Triticum aestivum]
MWTVEFLFSLAARLDSIEWDTQCEAILDLRSLAKYHSETLQEFLGTIIPLIIAKVVKGRPAVVKSAIMACGDLLLVYPSDSISTFVDQMIDSLVLKVIGMHRFVAQEAILVLTSMARRLHVPDHILLSKVIPLLHERSPFVCAKAYQFLALCLPVSVLERNDFIIEFAILMKAHLLKRKS